MVEQAGSRVQRQANLVLVVGVDPRDDRGRVDRHLLASDELCRSLVLYLVA